MSDGQTTCNAFRNTLRCNAIYLCYAQEHSPMLMLCWVIKRSVHGPMVDSQKGGEAAEDWIQVSKLPSFTVYPSKASLMPHGLKIPQNISIHRTNFHARNIFKHSDASNLRYSTTFVNVFVWIECVKKNMASPQFLLFSKPNQNLVLIFAFHALVFKFPTYHAVMCMVGTENRRKSVTKFMQKKFEKFEEKVCYDAWWHQKEEERVIRRRDPNICLVYW